MQKAIATLLLFSCLQVNAQNIGIGTTTPAASAILDVSSTNKGLLIPRMTTAQRNAIASPVVGLQIFNLDDQCTDIYDGANWIKNCGLKVVSSITEDIWTPKTLFIGLRRSGAVGFSIGSKGYIGTGKGDNTNYKDFWEYDPVTNVWTQKALFGGSGRSGAVGFSIGSKGYIGTGDDGSLKNDFWEYDPAINTWTQKAPVGGPGRSTAVGFSIGSKGYIGTGKDNFGSRYDFWEYDPANDIWTQKSPFGGPSRQGAVGFAIGNRGYIGTGNSYGNSNYNDFYEYDPASNTWTQKAPFGGTERSFAVGFSISNKGYIGTGSDFSPKNDYWEYDPASNIWTQKANVGGPGRSAAVGFSIGNKGYIGTGFSNNVMNDFWEYDRDYTTGYNYNSNPISIVNNTITDGAWTLANGTVYNANSGNVGIGTSTPTNKLSITGSADITGNVGIGTTSPVAKLHITAGNGTGGLRIDASANTSALSISGTGSFNIDAFGIIGGRLAVKDDGKIGIGTNSPTELLEVNGTLKAKTLNANAWKTQSATPNGYANMGGVVMQWGTVDYKEHNNKTVTYPVAFTEVFSVTLTLDNNNVGSNGGNIPPKLWRVENSYFELGGTQVFSGGLSKVRWMAVGR